MIDALESFLGVAGDAGSFAPREDQASLLEGCVNAFNSAPSHRMRSWLLPAILAACCALAILCLLTGRLVGAGVFASLGLWTAAADFVLVGIRRKTPLFLRVCELMASWRLSEWLTAAAALAILVVLLVILQLFWVWLGLGLLAIGIAVAFHAAFDRQAEAERRAPLEQVEEMLRALRLQGRDEDALRQFVCVYSGKHWEEFYEALFGYDAKREARQRWGQSERTGSRPRFAWLARSDRGLARCGHRRASRGRSDRDIVEDRRKKPPKPGRNPGIGAAQRRGGRRLPWWPRPPTSGNRSARMRRGHGQSVDRLGDARSGGQAGEGSARTRARIAHRA